MTKFLPVLGCALIFSSPVLATDNLGSAAAGLGLQWSQGKICTAEYKPVCATKNGRRREYSNRCRAEVDGATNIRPGKCPRRR